MIFNNYRRLKAWLIREVIFVERTSINKNANQKRLTALNNIKSYIKFEPMQYWLDDDYIIWMIDRIYEELMWFTNNDFSILKTYEMETNDFINALSSCNAKMPNTVLNIDLNKGINEDNKKILQNRINNMYKWSDQIFYSENDKEDIEIKKYIKQKEKRNSLFNVIKSIFIKKPRNDISTIEDKNYEDNINSAIAWIKNVNLKILNENNYIPNEYKKYEDSINYLKQAIKGGYMIGITHTNDISRVTLKDIKNVYRKYIWIRYRFDNLDMPVSKYCLYLAINHYKKFKLILQKVLRDHLYNNIPYDDDCGYYGPKTFLALKSSNVNVLSDYIIKESSIYGIDLNNI